MTEQTFKAFESYNFENDINFQSGLPSILNSHKDKPKEKLNALIEKAKYFYYSKIIQGFDYDDYLAWKTNTKKSVSSNIEDNTVSTSRETSVRDVNNNPQTEQAADNPQYPRTFHQLVEMISKEQPIPGIKQIPNELNKGTPSNPTIKPRPKPWEKKNMNNEFI
ncbi:unnamed protein product [Rhizophagus irregularis]|uniref:Uncharacterized protein n=1 Tax=Rhizophagus irregularis TaxID=588596 RepID=A0A2I1GL25_9GLOM|nr:hypothetical protein RhiirA4_403329 [Rhizophagus irregularis]CAB4415136.1 unnamed protein product [Rhizophagus irregularis]